MNVEKMTGQIGIYCMYSLESTECKRSIIFVGQFCGGIAYNPDSHICCCGKAKKKTFGSHCCGQENYNPDEKVCCPNDSLVSFGGNCS